MTLKSLVESALNQS